jgi:hypothetical protein
VATFSIFNVSPTPVTGTAFNDNGPLELGMAFTVAKAGWITDLLYYRPQQGSNVAVTRELRLWRHSTKALLATAQVTTAAGSFGWQKAKLSVPVKIAASTRYVVSYRTSDWYQSANNYFNSVDEVGFDGRDDNAYSDPSGTIRAGQSSSTYANGVYAYGSPIVMPSQTFQKCNYWLDVVFTDQDPGVVTPPPALPVITVTASPNAVAEDGAANLIYTFTRTGDLGSPLTVNYSINGSATSGNDYAAVGTSVTFAAGSATAVVTVDPTADTTVEPNETVALTLATGSGYTIGTPGAVTGTITNDDAVAPPPPPPSGALMGWDLNAANTGLAPHGLVGSQLPLYMGPSVIPAGSVISGVRFETNIDLSRGNIVIEKCCFKPTPAGYGQGLPLATTTDFQREPYPPAPSKVIIRDCEFDGSLLSAERAAFAVGFWGIADLQRNYFHHLGGGFALYNTGSQLDSLVEGNYVVDMIAWGNPATTGNHIDAFSIRDFSAAQRPARTAIIRNNRFDPTTQSNVTGAFFIQPLWERIDNVTIEGNLLAGAGWCLGLEQKTGYSNMKAINNRFAPTGFGATYYEGPGWTTWQENYRYDPTKIDAKGAPVGP